jgi:ACS family hexuronate transporter-like MFS transporter
MTYRQVRWIIVGLLCLSTVLNYIDRQTLSILVSTLRKELSLSERDYANAVSAFLLSYTVMYAVAGRLVDRIGARIGVVACMVWWSVATMLTALARSARSLALFRFLLGMGEPGIFPAGLKALAEWFPTKERALPAGIFSSGSALGAVLAPPLIVWITLRFGWREAFLIPGAAGLLWVPLWWAVFASPARHPAASPAERERWRQPVNPAPGTRAGWVGLLKQRRVWGLVLPRIASDPVWYFYLFWLPDYLQRERGFSLADVGRYGWVPFLAADVGGMGGGALSDWLVRRGMDAARARMLMLAGVGCLAPLGALTGVVTSTVAALASVSLVAALCQCWSANIATLALDVFPEQDNASVVGMMGTAGSLGGVFFSQALSLVMARFGYPGAFTLAAALHPIALVTLLALFRPARIRS